MMRSMLRLADDWVWDSWAADDGIRHHLYYLQAPRMPRADGRHDRARVGHATSTDLVSWDVLGETFGPGPAGAFDDLATWTGSVVAAGDGSWRLFYTGVSTAGHGLRDQRLGMARSTDLHHWTDRSTAPLAIPDPRWYKTLADYPDVSTTGPALDTVSETWRDPYAVRDPGGDGWHLLVTARAVGAARNDDGVVAHLYSADLVTWRVLPPLSSPGTGFGQLEVLQTRQVDGRWLLVFTCHPQEMTPERIARTGEFCTWSVPCDGPLGPFHVDAVRPFVADPTLFAAPLVLQRDGTSAILGFHNLEDRGGESFEICDPIPVTVDADGYLVAR
jgi:beta-fructofuranosidase